MEHYSEVVSDSLLGRERTLKSSSREFLDIKVRLLRSKWKFLAELLTELDEANSQKDINPLRASNVFDAIHKGIAELLAQTSEPPKLNVWQLIKKSLEIKGPKSTNLVKRPSEHDDKYSLPDDPQSLKGFPQPPYWLREPPDPNAPEYKPAVNWFDRMFESRVAKKKE